MSKPRPQAARPTYTALIMVGVAAAVVALAVAAVHALCSLAEQAR